MKFDENGFRMFQAEEGGAEGGTGGGAAGTEGDKGAGGEGAKTFTQEDVDRLIAQETAGLKANQQALQDEAKAAKRALKAYDGVDPEEYAKLKQAADEATRKQAEAKGDFKALEEQLIKRHQRDLDAKEERITKIMGALERRLVEAELTKAITAAKGDANLLLPHAARYVKMREHDDDFEAYVVDEAGNPMVSDGRGTPASFDDLVREHLMPKFPRAFDGVGSSGGGASKSTVGDRGTVGAISADDPDAFLANLEDIASGKTTVR